MIHRLNDNRRGNIQPISFRYNPIIQKVSIKVQEEYKLNINNLDIRYSFRYHPTKMVLGTSEEIS